MGGFLFLSLRVIPVYHTDARKDWKGHYGKRHQPAGEKSICQSAWHRAGLAHRLQTFPKHVCMHSLFILLSTWKEKR